ncbi:hypothetical protein GH714_005715 [Hevea brasiliensis]|uniref:RNase H type-1 domain-containing protein n=1 Tax=Hevea brasiliensis TaxID=3981 RepID=A0A6A6N9E7_HEVBR|nr:hypothetical protein GH714_005715 [Hevea brasiliensis]
MTGVHVMVEVAIPYLAAENWRIDSLGKGIVELCALVLAVMTYERPTKCTVTNEDGLIMAFASKIIRANWSPDNSEALAISYGLHLFVELGFNKLLVESDCLKIIEMLHHQNYPSNALGNILLGDLDFSQQLDNYLWILVNRSANRVAHALAKIHATAEWKQVWIEEVPGCIAPFVSHDVQFPLFLMKVCLLFKKKKKKLF